MRINGAEANMLLLSIDKYETMAATLLLNSDCSPVSFLPLSVLSWQESITQMYLDKASVIEWHDDWYVRSSTWKTQVPAVMILKKYEKIRNTVRFSKNNVFLRDGYLCQYCGHKVNKKTATLDHVLPSSLGGKTNYENCVCACITCNGKKGNDARIKPSRKPVKPSYYYLVDQRKRLPFEIAHPSWYAYLGIENTHAS